MALREIEEQHRDRFVVFPDPGQKTEKARRCKRASAGSCVKIRLLEIRQFCAVRDMHLALFIDSVEHSGYSLQELGLKEGGGDLTEDLLIFGLYNGDYTGFSGKKAFSRLLGKRLVPPLPKEKSGFWGFTEPVSPKYVDFIIGVDEDGNEVTSTSSEDELSNYFGANPGRPHYLTPVFFRKAVLDKYHQQGGKYSVEPGYLRCAGLWGIRIDNHLRDYVVAWLGDLGRDLPYQEQLHWRSFNIPPTGSISETFFRQQILGEWVDTERPEHLFKYEYSALAGRSQHLLEWQVLLPLSTEDQHYLQAIRIPATDEQRNFDEFILALTRILVDSLNEKELNRLVSAQDREEAKGGISRLEKAFENRLVPGYAEHIRFLRDLQDLRSSGVAHRKGRNYRRLAGKIGIDAQSLREVAEALIIKGLAFVRFLRSVVESDAFRING